MSARILVVDDEADIRSLLEEILAEEGYEVVVAANAAEARKQYGTANPDLVLLDIWMPDADGISLLREWSANKSKPACPVVMMSGHGTVETAVEANRIGAYDFLEKPLDRSRLLLTIQNCLAHRQALSDRELTDPSTWLDPRQTAPHLLEWVERNRQTVWAQLYGDIPPNFAGGGDIGS